MKDCFRQTENRLRQNCQFLFIALVEFQSDSFTLFKLRIGSCPDFYDVSFK